MKTTEEKIREGLKACADSEDCANCPYEPEKECARNLNSDALTRIKQLETKIAEYEKAMEEGRLVMLPCKPGDDMYWLDNMDEEHEGWCVKCDKRGVGAVVVRGKDDFAVMSKGTVQYGGGEIEEIGGRWTYLTEEDAQKALEEMGNATL